ncbi:unnamed protein product [Lupinus luteus]|uniref:Uncharacterized protein n=1 Tax=Lupinus luteus TaxID=3873 RepID=A0AAV1WYT6_LUPLU
MNYIQKFCLEKKIEAANPSQIEGFEPHQLEPHQLEPQSQSKATRTTPPSRSPTTSVATWEYYVGAWLMRSTSCANKCLIVTTTT